MSDTQSPFPAFTVPVVFLVFACLFLADPWGAVPEPPAYQPRDPSFADPAPPRKVSAEAPRLVRGSMSYGCAECHRHFDTSRASVNRTVAEHTEIVLEHGPNNRCLNCHHPEDREQLVNHDGSPLPFAKVSDLCAKCHGPIARDWRKGIHGRRSGSWVPNSPDRAVLQCTACHDPHSPSFKPLRPAPPPEHPVVGRGRKTVTVARRETSDV